MYNFDKPINKIIGNKPIRRDRRSRSFKLSPGMEPSTKKDRKITGTQVSGYGFKIGDNVTYKGSKWLGIVSSIDRRDEPKPIAVIWSHTRDTAINYKPRDLIKR